MFEVGKSYRIHWNEGGDDGVWQTVVDVIEVDGPLIKVKQPGTREIINTHSPNFFKAELVNDPELDEEGRQAMADIQINFVEPDDKA
jgi:hypothetical protein